MRLSAFISSNLDAIVDEWASFAKTLLPVPETLSSLAMRDHCRQILLAAVADMQARATESQCAAQPPAQSPGHAPLAAGLPAAGPDTAATAHGTLRHLSGFDLAQLVAEFAALRASVLALWRRQTPAGVAAEVLPSGSEIDQIMRFNGAIDQALAASACSYASAVSASRDRVLAVLGHDLRTPLQTISMTVRLLLKPALSDTQRSEAAMRIQRCSSAMGLLISDVLTLPPTRPGSGTAPERSACEREPVGKTTVETTGADNPR